MSDILVTTTLPAENGKTEDAVVNSFAIRMTGATPAEAAAVAIPAVEAFWESIPPTQGSPLGAFIGATQERSAEMCIARAYDITTHLDGSPHGSPVAEDAFSLPAALNAETGVAQVAGVITLRARAFSDVQVEIPGGPGDPAPTVRPRARRTGRLYIGPLTTPALVFGAGVPARLSAGFRANAVHSAEMLQDTLEALGAVWCVWSRAGGTLHAVIRAECDDSPDVIRSRKVDQSARDVRTFAPVPNIALGA